MIRRSEPALKPGHRFELLLSVVFLSLFALWFGYDLYTLKRHLAHPEYVHYYHSFRIWFLEQLRSGHFPQWNPYWGIGHSAEIEASFPVDIYTPLELLFGPQYHWFQLLQLLLIFGAGLWGFRQLGLSPLLATLGTLFFFLSPWVTYFYFYFIKSNSFIGLLLTFPLAIRWFEHGEKGLLPLISLITALLMFGTKLDFWFFHFVFTLLLSLLLAPRNRKRLLPFWIAIALGIGCHLWQIVPLYQILQVADRLGHPPGLAALTDSAFYYRLGLSVASSGLLKSLLFGALFLIALNRRSLLVAGLSTVLFFAMKMPTQAPFLGLASPFGAGALVGVLILFFHERKLIPKALCFFLPLAFYWCRQPPSDLNEMTILLSSPVLFQIVAGIFSMLGANEVARRQPVARIAYLAIVILFILRDQGQVILSHLFGLVWIPSRDNFIFDLLFATLGVLGLSRLKFAKVWALAGILVVTLSASSNFYYSHPLIEKTPPGFPFYEGIPQIKRLLLKHKVYPEDRFYFAGMDFAKQLPMFGASLLTKTQQVTQFSSFIPKRYHDWMAEEWFGIRPEERWASYEGEYTSATIEKLPPRNTKGISTNNVYWWTLHALPPPTLEALRFLGVKHVISLKEGKYLHEEVPDPFPRAYGVIDGEVVPADIVDYEPERVRIQTDFSSVSTLVLTDLFHPFWKAFLDGAAVPIIPAHNLFRSVVVPAGRHTLEFRCEIPWLKAAFAVSLGAWVFLMTWLIPPFVSRFSSGKIKSWSAKLPHRGFPSTFRPWSAWFSALSRAATSEKTPRSSEI